MTTNKDKDVIACARHVAFFIAEDEQYFYALSNLYMLRWIDNFLVNELKSENFVISASTVDRNEMDIVLSSELSPSAQEESRPLDMEQGTISIVTPNNVTENANGKTKAAITLPTAARISNAARIKAPRLKSLLQDECSAWELTKSGLAELIGTAMLIFLGCMGCVGSLGNSPTPFQVSFVFGFAVMLVIQSIGHISGAHINPAITIGSVVMGKKSLMAASVYIFAQCLGAVLGYGLLKIVTPQALLYSSVGASSSDSFCITDLHTDISVIQGFLGEIIATGILMFMTCACWDERNEKNTDSTAIKFGLSVAVLCMALGPYTGCSMNPARSLAPAIWNNYWSHHWIFWFGPIGGSLLASVGYLSIFSPKKNSSPERSTVTENIQAQI